jgi:hypothetical protein
MFSHEHAGRGASAPLPGATTNPGANRAKEYELMACPPAPGPPARGGGTCPYLNVTTLGNGYLGSRIDEERSEMRYLV